MKYTILLSILITSMLGSYAQNKLSGQQLNINQNRTFIYTPKAKKPQVFYGIAGIQKPPFDSAKYYFRKHNYYQTKLEKIIKRMDENPYAVYDRNLFSLEDSCRKYKTLLTEYNKK